MCFSQEMSFIFATVGLLITFYVYRKKQYQLAVGIFFFVLMEMLQAAQFFYIDDCENPVNKVLTLLGFLHICLQPYFTHLMSDSLPMSQRTKDIYSVIKRLSLLGKL